MDNAFEPPAIICFAITVGSPIVLILPNDGDENFTSVSNVACGLDVMICLKSWSDFFRFTSTS